MQPRATNRFFGTALAAWFCVAGPGLPGASAAASTLPHPAPETTATKATAHDRWHAITVAPAPGVPRIHFFDRLNPYWWLQNADDPVPPAWYLPQDRHRNLKWRFRNPFHNFDHYVIGIADRTFHRYGRYPERNSDPQGGWDFEVARWKFVVLPFVSYDRHWCRFYFGWREHGAFGVKLNF